MLMTVIWTKRAWLLPGIVVVALALVWLCGCLNVPRSPTRESTLGPSHYSPCDSAEFDLPPSIMQHAEKMDSEVWAEMLLKGRREQLGWLSVQLELFQDAAAYGAPVPFRLTITNTRAHPVIFDRPVNMGLLAPDLFSSPFPVHLFFEITTSSGERIELPPGLPYLQFPPRTAEMFTLLPAGESCVVEAQLDWAQMCMPPDEPLSPGTYRVRVVLRGSDLGPQTESYEHLDIGAWVGSTVSNPVTLTVRPPEK
jgi:hypothetical protein